MRLQGKDEEAAASAKSPKKSPAGTPIASPSRRSAPDAKGDGDDGGASPSVRLTERQQVSVSVSSSLPPLLPACQTCRRLDGCSGTYGSVAVEARGQVAERMLRAAGTCRKWERGRMRGIARRCLPAPSVPRPRPRAYMAVAAWLAARAA